jgi:hypothetical protein
VACDSLYCAYLKGNYPLEFFETVLNYYANKSAKEKITEIKKEAEQGFNIKILPITFRSDNRKFQLDKEKNAINESMTSIKYLNKQISKELYSLRNNIYNNFFEVLEAIYKQTAIQSNQLDILIKLDYFREFGSSNILLGFVNIFNKFWNKATKTYRKQISKDKVFNLKLNKNIIERLSNETDKTYNRLNTKEILKEYSYNIEEIKFDLTEKIVTELEYLGYIRYRSSNKKDRHKVFILDIDFGNSELINPKVLIYSLYTGKIAKLKIKRVFCRFQKYSIIHITKIESKPKYLYKGTNDNGKPIFRQSETEKDW